MKGHENNTCFFCSFRILWIPEQIKSYSHETMFTQVSGHFSLNLHCFCRTGWFCAIINFRFCTSQNTKLNALQLYQVHPVSAYFINILKNKIKLTIPAGYGQDDSSSSSRRGECLLQDWTRPGGESHRARDRWLDQLRRPWWWFVRLPNHLGSHGGPVVPEFLPGIRVTSDRGTTEVPLWQSRRRLRLHKQSTAQGDNHPASSWQRTLKPSASVHRPRTINGP